MIEFPVQYQVNYLNSVHHGTEQAVRKFWMIRISKAASFPGNGLLYGELRM